MAVWSIVRFNVVSNYKIEVSFSDGTTGIADLEHGALTWAHRFKRPA